MYLFNTKVALSRIQGNERSSQTYCINIQKPNAYTLHFGTISQVLQKLYKLDKCHTHLIISLNCTVPFMVQANKQKTTKKAPSFDNALLNEHFYLKRQESTTLKQDGWQYSQIYAKYEIFNRIFCT